MGASTKRTSICNHSCMILLALAAQIAMPISSKFWSIFSPDDMPREVMDQGTGAWGVSVAVTVAPDGKIVRCDIERSSGIREADVRTCDIIRRRARFQSAVIDGQPATAVLRATVSWAVAENIFDLDGIGWPDADVRVVALPKGVKNPVNVSVMFKVGTDGHKSDCQAVNDALGDSSIANAALVSVACAELMGGVAKPALDAAGNPVPSVQNGNVRFSVEKKK